MKTHQAGRSGRKHDDHHDGGGTPQIDRRKSEIDVIEHVIGGVRTLLQENAEDHPPRRRKSRKPRR